MKFLIVDDDEYKVNQVMRTLEGHQVDVAKSYVGAMRKIVANKYDGVVLDMCFPLYDEEFDTLKKDQGVSVLQEVNRPTT